MAAEQRIVCPIYGKNESFYEMLSLKNFLRRRLLASIPN